MIEVYAIRGHSVTVDDARTRIHFAGGAEGKVEAGDYFFWTTVGRDRFGDWKITGRARSTLPPTDRFTRIQREMRKDCRIRIGKRIWRPNKADRAAYAAMWRRLDTIEGLRAANMREVVLWLRSHKPDARFIRPPFIVEGRPFKRLPAMV